MVDVSGSMNAEISAKSKMNRQDAASGIAILLRECCEKTDVFTFSDHLKFVPNRHGMALRDAINMSQGHSGTYLGRALTCVAGAITPDKPIDRLIVITDEQSHDPIPKMPIKHCYVINVGTYQNGIQNNGQWLTINGFSENVIDYILEIEKESRDS